MTAPPTPAATWSAASPTSETVLSSRGSFAKSAEGYSVAMPVEDYDFARPPEDYHFAMPPEDYSFGRPAEVDPSSSMVEVR